MGTTTTNPEVGVTRAPAGASESLRTRERAGVSYAADTPPISRPSQRDALQALLAFSALHEQIRRRKALAFRHRGFDQGVEDVAFEAARFESARLAEREFESNEQFVLDEVLQLVAERAIAITGADGLAIALAENDEIVLRAAAGTVRPDVGARIDRDSAFSGACFRTAEIIHCDDTETDARVNLQACRSLKARSMIAVPLCGRRRVIGLLEAFSAEPFGFNESDIASLTLLAELVVGALKPEDEERFAQSAAVAATRLESKPSAAPAQNIAAPPAVAKVNAVDAKPAVLPPAIAPVISKPVESKPVESRPVEVAPTPSTAILNVTPSEPKKTSKSESELQSQPKSTVTATAASPETTPEPKLTFGQIEPEKTTHRWGVVLSLIGFVIAMAFIGGMWWKLKTAQIGSAMVPSAAVQEKNAPRPGATVKDLTAAPVPAAPSSNPEVAAPSATDAIDDTTEADNAPATAQEMSKFPRVTGIRHWSSADSSTVVLDLEDQVQYEEHQITNPNRFYYDLRDTQLAPELAGKSIDIGDAFLTRIRVAQPTPGMTRVVLETKGGVNITPGVSLEPNPYRLVIVVRKPGTDSKGAVNLFPNAPEAEKNKLAIVVPPPSKEDLQLRTHVPKMRIVVDAGHGGWDLGTVGRRGLLEKDLVLEIAQRLGKLLESRLGADVILTRNDDNYIPLDERAEIANQSQADLFISVHANYSDLPSARGVETYYTNFFSAPGSKESVKNPGALPASVKTQATPNLSAIDLHERIEQSRRLAASVQRSLYGTLSAENPGLRDRGIKEAGFVVLTESAMPGILAEVSFVSSPTDEQKLRSDGYREEIAEALYKGIARYAASSKVVKVASK